MSELCRLYEARSSWSLSKIACKIRPFNFRMNRLTIITQLRLLNTITELRLLQRIA
jgi:hypothetical protein